MHPIRVEHLEDRLLFAFPAYDHVVVVIEENKSPMSVIGNSAAPYINSLATNGAYLSQSYATHRPSQPNYIALFSGSNQGVTTNDVYNLGNVANLGSQLIGTGKSFNNYSEGLPSVGYTGATSGRYARKHNPAPSFSNVPATSNRPYTDFPTDYTKLPTVSFVVPNLDNDSHDGTLGESDTWLKNNLSAYAEWAKTHNSLLIVTYDEGDIGDATNHIPTIFYGSEVRIGNYANQIKHYNVLRTIEDIYGLTPLANAASAATIDYVFTTNPPPVLSTPTDLLATAVSGTQINLTWTDVNNAETGYKIERSTDGVNFSPLAGTGINGHSYNNTNLTAGKRYYYRVYAVNVASQSPRSNIASAVTPPDTPTIPAMPSGLTASPVSSSQINLSWTDNSTIETGFRIERSSEGVNFTFLADVGANVKTYSNTGLAASQKVYYHVKALGSVGDSPYSNVANATTSSGTSTTPAAPGNLIASAVSTSQINLSWTDNANNETGFRIERSTDGTNFGFLANVATNATSYPDTGLAAATKYYYRVQAIGSPTSSAFSNIANATTQSVTQPGVPAAPTNLTARGSTSVANAIDLTWTDNANNETGYKIERSTDGVHFSALAGGGPNTTFNRNTNLTPGKLYYYRVYAVNAAGSSAFSNIASATTTSTGGTTPPAAPSNLTATATSTSVIHLAWADNASTETGYRVERSTDGTNFSFVTNLGANVTTLDDGGRAAATKYWYRVQAIGSPSNSAYSNVASATTQGSTSGVPAAPTNLNLAVSTTVANSINLSWNDNATTETGYKIERSSDGINFAPLAGGGANMNFYRNTNLTPGKKYWYRVYAVNASGNSPFSNVASLVLPAAAPLPAAMAVFSIAPVKVDDPFWA